METGLVSILTFLLGLLLGNWLAIGRDKRKEFNEAAAPIRGWLIKEKDEPNPYTAWPSAQEFDRFAQYLRPWEKAGFMQRLARYRSLHAAAQIQDAVGQVFYSNDSEIRGELNKLFKYTAAR